MPVPLKCPTPRARASALRVRSKWRNEDVWRIRTTTNLNAKLSSTFVSVRCAPPNGADFDGLVSTIDSGHLGALYGCEAEEAALAG